MKARNGNTACPSASWLPRPTDYQCDEYPFRSTKEGAYIGGSTARTHPWSSIALRATTTPSTGSAGYSICMINQKQNETAGTLLGQFYLTNRIDEASRSSSR